MDTWKKYWISPEGKLIELGLGQNHGYYAKRYFEEQNIEITFGEAVEQFIKNGWIRVQEGVDYVAMEGIENSILEHGDLIFLFKPDFKRVILSFPDTGTYKTIYRDKVEGWSWDSIVKEAVKGSIL